MKNRPAVKVLIPYLAGIILADRFSVNIVFVWIISAICLFAIFYSYKERWLSFSSVLLAVCFLGLGFLRYEISMTPPQNLDRVLYQQVRVYGIVKESQKERSGGSSLLVDGEAFLIKDPSISMKGKINIRSWEDNAFANEYGYGDIVELSGKLSQPRPVRNPGAFDYQKYLQRQGIFTTMTVNDVSEVQKIGSSGNFFLMWIRILQNRIECVIKVIANNDSNVETILRGIVLGEHGEMSSELYDAFRKTSTTHILVVSGVNFSILMVWTYWLFNILKKGILRIGIKNRFLENNLILYIPVFIIITIYAFIVGMEFSVLRAFIFISLFIIATLLSRDRDLFNILGIAALCILVISPGAFWDAGFQLTFAAVASITYFNPYWEKLLAKIKGKDLHRRALYRILQGIAVSISAQFGAGLIIAYTFGTFSLSGTVVNPIIAPLVFVITPISFALCLMGVIYLPLVYLIAWLDYILISMLIDIVSRFAEITLLIYVKGFSLMHIVVIASFVIFAVNLPSLLRKKSLFKLDLGFQDYLNSGDISRSMKWEFENNRISLSQNAKAIIQKLGKKWLITDNPSESWQDHRQIYLITKEDSSLNVYQNRQSALIYGLAVLAVFCWAMAMNYDGYVAKITYLDVGEGDSMFVELPDNYNVLIDGGSRNRYNGSYRNEYSSGERVVAPFLRREGVGNIDLVVSTHPDNDHTGGLIYILDNFHVKEALTGSYGLTSPTYKEFTNRLNGIEYHDARPEIIYDNGDIKIEVLSGQYHGILKNEDSRMNNNSVVLKLTYKEASFLFTGDIEKDAERQFVNSGRDVKATVIKVPHHGSGSSSSYDFIRAVQPSAAVFSVGYKNFYHHPSPYVVARYIRSGVKIYRTDRQGAVTVITDGRYGWIKTMSP